MTQKTAAKRFVVARPAELSPIPCPCGEARRAFLDDPDGVASLHVTDISVDARTHYHKRLTELYYILEGEGEMELDDERHAVRPGDAILIKPLCRHRAIGRLRALIVPVPAFDLADEWFD
jgi:mannose-6-phosphate isomerase-like protein (cupin superfamily)